jgi:hypothetical protein
LFHSPFNTVTIVELASKKEPSDFMTASIWNNVAKTFDLLKW